jgi:hypothetical protein
MHLLTHLRAKIALLFAGALLWSAPAWAETYVLSYWDFNALAQSLGTTTLTSSGAYQVVGQTNPEWTDKSVTTTQFGDTLAFTQLYGTASKGFYLRDRRSYNAAQCGLYSLTENHTLTIRQLKKDYVVTLTGQSSVIKEAYTGNYGGAWTATANADSTEYVYTMTADGDLNLLCSAWVYLYTLKIEGPIPDVYTPTLEVIEGTDNTSKLLQFNCRTQSAQILYTITYADGTTESGHCQPGGQVCISKTASSITAQAVVNEGTTEEQTSDPLVKSNIIAGQVAAPTVTVTAVYYGERTVSFACTTEGATVFYRTADDGEYTTDSTVVISDTTTFSVFATLPDVYTDALFVSDTVSVKVGAGTSIRLVGVTYAAVGDSITMTANQSSVLCKPSATISYTYTPFDKVAAYGPARK